jgi:hypothetical protein
MPFMEDTEAFFQALESALADLLSRPNLHAINKTG